MIHDNRMYNGFEASWVTSKGALKNDIAAAKTRAIGRGVLLDVARWKGKPWLDPGEIITADDLQGCSRSQAISIGTGDILLVRTGRLGQAKAERAWNGFDNARVPSPGLGLQAIPWLYENEIAAVASDNLAVEVLPGEVPEVQVPLHIICLVYMGLTLGEIFDLEELAEDCAADGVYEFQFIGPPLPFTGAVGSPTNPIAIK
jgi:kynurenine formamidase